VVVAGIDVPSAAGVDVPPCAAHELADARLPGTAGTTMIGDAASLMFEAFEIKQAIARRAGVS
jgi:hypothetical protein